ncbi:MAG: hypothetical protein JJV92_00325 [Desulfosarcina sp.]|nr:hypothetical protein [Desulfobacterales bacterium]
MHYITPYILEDREVDFAVIKEGCLIELIEAKYSDDNISRHLVYYAKRLEPEKATRIVAKLSRPYDKGKIKVVDSITYFREPI